MSDSLTILEDEITAAGHQLERTYEGKVADSPGAEDRGWVVHVDGELVATGGSVGRVEAGLRDWWEGSAPRGNTDAGG